LTFIAIARQEMIDEGFDPDFPPGVDDQLLTVRARGGPVAGGDVRDLREVWLWSSIDIDTSRDLDQFEAAERVDCGIRVLVAIADVDSDVAVGTKSTSIYRALVHNRAQLTYNSIGAWLEGKSGAPPKIGASAVVKRRRSGCRMMRRRTSWRSGTAWAR